MKIIRNLLALIGLTTLIIAGYCYYSACKNPIEVVVIQNKIGKKAEKEIKKDGNKFDEFEKDPAHQEEEVDGIEAGLTIAGEAA